MSSAGSGDPSSVPADPPDRHTDPAQGSVRWRSDGSATGQKRRPRGCLIGLGVAAVVVGGLTLWAFLAAPDVGEPLRDRRRRRPAASLPPAWHPWPDPARACRSGRSRIWHLELGHSRRDLGPPPRYRVRMRQ